MPTFGPVLGYASGTSPTTSNRSSVVNLAANVNVQFVNLETANVPHTASSLGSWSGSFPAGGPTSASLTTSAAGTSISAHGFTTGNLKAGKASHVFSSGAPGMTVIGCFYHYASNEMRTVVIVM